MDGVKVIEALSVPAEAVPIVGGVGFLPADAELPGIGSITRSNRRLTPNC